jgi:hypothetical protein
MLQIVQWATKLYWLISFLLIFFMKHDLILGLSSIPSGSWKRHVVYYDFEQMIVRSEH